MCRPHESRFAVEVRQKFAVGSAKCLQLNQACQTKLPDYIQGPAVTDMKLLIAANYDKGTDPKGSVESAAWSMRKVLEMQRHTLDWANALLESPNAARRPCIFGGRLGPSLKSAQAAQSRFRAGGEKQWFYCATCTSEAERITGAETSDAQIQADAEKIAGIPDGHAR